MKVNALSSVVLALPYVAAFPLESPAWSSMLASSLEKRQLPNSPPPFDAKAQYVSTSGKYAFVAPGPNDIRGECPGLNAMANHGYLPHNGMATIQQFIDATNTVFGMSPDLGEFLAVYGAVIDGNGLGWSILGGPHQGIGGSHGNYETDSSPLKSDLSQYGSNTRTINSQFMTLYNMQSGPNSNYNLTVLREFRHLRYQESVQKNPNFYYGPFSGIAVSQAAFTFIYRFMSNKSAEYPEGVLNKAVLKSFMSYTGPEDNLTHTWGNERIPDNWYKRNSQDEYSIPYFITDIGFFGGKYPEIFQPGCNNGTVDSFMPFSPQTLTNGVYGSDVIASKPLCFGTTFIRYQAQSFLGLSLAQIAPLTSVLDKVNAKMGGCPAATFNEATLKGCPGFSNYGGPSGPVAPGAIQS